MMKKFVSLILSAVMLLTLCATLPAFAAEATVKQIAIEGRMKPILEIDGLQFKDLNNNGELDVYEDWRCSTEDRITDLLGQMTLEEKVALLFHCMTAGQFSPTYPVTEQFLYEQDCPFEADILNGRYTTGYSIWYYVNEYNITHFLDDQTGTPAELADYHNKAQEIGEESRLGIPITFSSNRESNTWGSMIDMPHTAFGVANDLDLAKQLWTIYGQEMAAVGYHITLNPFGVELGGWYGENPNYLAELTKTEVEAMQAGGIETCVKHFIARGNPGLSFSAARSVGQLVGNWMVPWKAAVDAGTGWIMTNTSTGLTNTVRVDYDKETMSYLRDTLGYDGVVVTDWGPVGGGSRIITGITADGIDLSTLSLGELYTMMLENGVDQFGAVSVLPGEDTSTPRDISNWPDALINAVLSGACSEDLIDRSARRILRSKFNLGLFENPYVEVESALEIAASAAYIAEPWEITGNASLDAVRNPLTVTLDHQLQAKATVLIKNDDAILPLADGVAVYVTGTAETTALLDAESVGVYGAVVDTMDAADVVVARVSTIDDAMKQIVADAANAGKAVVLALDCVAPNAWAVENADAILYMNYKGNPDHGSSLPGFIFTTDPWILADMLFGRAQPEGMLVREIARNEEQAAAQWNDLANDAGASDTVRLLLMQMVKEDPYVDLPTNFGDPLFTYGYGMRYGIGPDFEYNTLLAPETVAVGATFTVRCIIDNNSSSAGYTTAEVFDGDTLLASKFMALDGDQFRVVEIECVLSEVGEHTLSLGGLTATVIVE